MGTALKSHRKNYIEPASIQRRFDLQPANQETEGKKVRVKTGES